MEDKDTEVIKQNLKELFQFGIYKLDNNLCMPEELRSLEQMAEGNLKLNGTVSDFAKFYGVSENSIRTTIHRKLISKPARKVLYPFHKFSKIVPESWRRKGLGKIDQAHKT